MLKRLLLILSLLVISMIGMADEPIVVEPVQNTQLEADVARMVNELRNAFGVHCLSYNDTLATSGRNHLIDMDERGYFSHNTPEGKTPEDRAREAGFAGWAVESLIAGRATPTEAMSGWRASRLHYRGFFFTYSHEMGIGYYVGGKQYSHYYGYIQGRLDSGSPGELDCVGAGVAPITVTHVPTGLAAANTNTANPTFTWTHDTTTANGRTPATEYAIEIIQGTDVFSGPIIVDKSAATYSAAQICSGNTCTLPLTTPLTDGEYMLFVRAYSPTGDYVWTGDAGVFGDTAEALTFTIAISDQPTPEPTPDPTAEPTPEPTLDPALQINLISPVGVVGDSHGRPLYQWNHIPTSTGYELYLAPSLNITSSNYYGTLDAATYCNVTTCSVDLTTITPYAWLSIGSYTLYINPVPGNLTTWQGPFTFDISEGQPAAATPGQVFNTDTLNPVVAWYLSGAAANSAFFELYVAPSDDLLNVAYNGWVTRQQVCNGWTGIACSFAFPEDLINGRTYSWYMRSWGPGGFSYGGLANTGWMEGTPFTVNDPDAPFPTPEPQPDTSQTAALLELINAERAALGIGCLAVNQDLVDAAYNHSVDMRDNDYFSHTGLDGSLPWDRAQREGYSSGYVGENIAAGSSTVNAVYQQWYGSDGHYANMTNTNFNEAGFALVQGGSWGWYATLVIGRRNEVGTVPCN